MKDVYKEYRALEKPEDMVKYLSTLTEEEYRELQSEFTVYGKWALNKQWQKAKELKKGE